MLAYAEYYTFAAFNAFRKRPAVRFWEFTLLIGNGIAMRIEIGVANDIVDPVE